MKTLLEEFAPLAAKAAECADWLAGQGIGADIVYRPGASIVGVARIEVVNTAPHFQPSPDGIPTIIVPVSYSYAPCELDPINLVAWQPGSPDHWHLRTGNTPVLGEAAIDRAVTMEEPVALYQSPLDWLHNRLDGAVILDWTACHSLYLGNVQRIIADNPALAEQIKHKLDEERCWPMPDIRIGSMADAA